MPAIGSQTGKSAAAEKKIAAAKKKRRPKIKAPKTQPGPISAAESKKIERHKRKPTYGKALGKARVHGPKTRRGKGPGEDKSVTPAQQKAIDRGVKRARIKYLRRTRKPPIDIRAELEGRGKLAEGFAKVGEKASKPGAQGLIKATSGGSPRPKKWQTPQYKRAQAVRTELVGNALKDLATFPAQAVPSVYVPVAAAVEAAKGDTSRGKKLIEDVKQTDPVYNTIAAGVEKIKGNEKAAESHIKKAAKSAKEHPGLTALEVAGIKGGTGRFTSRALRGGGRTVRRAGKVTGSKTVERAGEKVRKAGSTERASRRVPGTNIVETRAYSRDAFKKAAEVNAERRARKKAKDLHERADRARAKGHEKEAQDLRKQAHEADPDQFGQRSYGGVGGYGRLHYNRGESEIRRQVDEDIQLHEDIRRMHRAEAVQKTTRIVKGKVDRSGQGKITRVARIVTRADRHAKLRPSEQGVLNLVAQRIVRADKHDIEDRIRELKAAAKDLTGDELRQNKVQVKAMQKLVDDPKANMARLENAAKAFQEQTAPVQRKLAKLKVFDTEQMQRRVVIPYAVRRMGAKHDPEHYVDGEGRRVSDKEVNRVRANDPTAARSLYTKVPGRIVDGRGRELSTQKIIKHMKEHGESPAAFLTQAPNRRGAINFNLRSERAPGQGPKGTTGEATRKGTFDIHPDTLIEGAARGQGLVDATRHFRALVKRFGKRGEDGKIQRFDSKAEAEFAARQYLHDDNGDPNPAAIEMTPIRLNAIGNTKTPLEGLLDDVNKLTTDQQNAILESMKASFSGVEGEGKWALIPKAAADRIVEHLNTQGGGGGLKTVQLLNTQFRKTVLSTSPTWLAGNILEGSLRSALAHAGPRSWWTTRQTMKQLEELDPKAAEQLLSRVLGGGHFTSIDRSAMRRGAEQFANTDLKHIATALGKVWRTPGPKQLADLWHVYTDIVMRQLNGRFEKNVQMAMLGKALRQSPLMDQRVLKLQKAAYDDAARGLTNTDAQRAFGRQVDIMYGKYGKHSPAMKKLISTYTPFISWWLNSINFVYRTLPRDHPIVTAVIASAEMATEEWRKDHGLDQFIKGAAPGWLQGSIPLPGGGHFRAARYTPFGAFGDPLGTLAGQVTPAISSVIAAAQGRDWTGRELTVTDENGQKRKPNPLELALFAGHAFLTGTVPFLGVGERVVKEGPKVLNPLRATKPPKAKSAKIKKPSGFFGGSGGSKKSESFFGSGSSGSSGGGGSFFGD